MSTQDAEGAKRKLKYEKIKKPKEGMTVQSQTGNGFIGILNMILVRPSAHTFGATHSPDGGKKKAIYI